MPNKKLKYILDHEQFYQFCFMRRAIDRLYLRYKNCVLIFTLIVNPIGE
jgi:hypothetical protein